MSLPRFGVTHPVPVNLLMMATIIAGVVAGLSLRREFFPETTPEQANITLPYPGASPQEIEESMARKVEDALADLDEVERMETTISEGGGGILVEFRGGEDIRKAVDEVQKAIDALTDLPEDAEEIRVTEFEPTLPVIMLTLYGDADEEVMKRAIRSIRDDLKTLPGMGDIAISGVRDYEIRVDVSPAALLEHSISLPRVSDAISAWMRDVPGGNVRTSTGTISVRTSGVAEEAEEIRNIVVKATPGGQSLRVGDIATVREDFVDDQLERRFNGQPAVSLTVFKTGDQDAVAIAEMVRAYTSSRRGEEHEFSSAEAAIRPNMVKAWQLGASRDEPLPGQIATHSDLARFIEGRLSLLSTNAMQGAVLVFLTLLLFLNWRAAWWVMTGLVIALCGTMVMMFAFNITLNLLTMFGLIIVVGMLVDDAVVVAENIQSRHDQGEPSLQAAVRGAEQVFWPVVGTVSTTIVAFLPLTFVAGRIGDLLGALPYVVTVALIASLIESVLILPSHMAHTLIKRDQARPGRVGNLLRAFERRRDGFIETRVLSVYERIIRVMLEYRYISSAIVTAAFVISVGMVAGGRLPFVFLDDSDSETIVIDLRLPIGSAIEETQRLAGIIENAAGAQPETKSVATIVGQSVNVQTNLSQGNATHLAQLFVELVAVEERDRESSKVIDAIREACGPLDGIEQLRFSEVGGAGGGADITIQIKGNDEKSLVAVADGAKATLAKRAGVYDIADDNFDSQRELQIRLKPGAAALGFNVADVARQVRGTLFGLDAHVFSAKREDIDVRVRVDEAARRNLSTIDEMWVVSPTGARVPLPEIAELVEATSFSTIRRIDRQRAITVTADTSPAISPETIAADITPELDALTASHPGVTIDMGGRQRDFAKAFASLPIGMGMALLLIYVILAWLFANYLQPLVVMLAIPFGVIGAVWAHMAFGYRATFLSLIGFIALCGIVVNNSLIIVEFYNAALREGLSVRDALVKAGRQRLRPIVLTSITTFLGLTPLMLQNSFQAKFLIPMAISISFGLMSSTVLVLTALPCFMVIMDDIKRATYYLWYGEPRPEPTEQPIQQPALDAME